MLYNSNKIFGKSTIQYNYSTIKITQSRIDKGLIAIPRSLIEWFPKQNTEIQIYLGDSKVLQLKNFSSYDSSTKEARIGGMMNWFREQNLKDGNEIVIQVIDKANYVYRIIKEEDFLSKVNSLQNELDISEKDYDAESKIDEISKWVDNDKSKVALYEYFRLIFLAKEDDRKYLARFSQKFKEATNPSIRTLLGRIYKGHCQLCDFWFLKKDKKPYFEIHHIKPELGNFPQNLILVCANCHINFNMLKSDNFLIQTVGLKRLLSIIGSLS
jgi:hypothetical protein